MCDVKPCETFLARGRMYRVTEDTGEFPGERIRCGFVCTHSSMYTLALCRIRGKMEGFSVSIAFPLVRLHQEGKKKLISALSGRARETEGAWERGREIEIENETEA